VSNGPFKIKTAQANFAKMATEGRELIDPFKFESFVRQRASQALIFDYKNEDEK
jgi:hypothetical protein